MNFTDFTEDLSEEFGLTKTQSRAIITYLVKRLREKILFGAEVSFRHMGTFKLGISLPRKYLHLKKNVMMMSEKKYNLKFRLSQKMLNDLKEKEVY